MIVVNQMLQDLEKRTGLKKSNLKVILSSCRNLGDLLNMEKEEITTDQGKLRILLFRELFRNRQR